MNRTVTVAAGVVVFHVALLWALNLGLLRRAVELVVPVEVVARIIEIEPPKVAPPPPAPPPPAAPPKPVPKVTQTPPPPRPVAARALPPIPTAPVAVLEPQPVPAPAAPAPAAPADTPAQPAPPAPPAAPAPAPARLVEITQGETQYIRAPKPVYPALSKRTGEAGVVIVAVYYSAQGQPRRAEILKSSGFDRLDRAAREAVMASQVTPFQRPGISDSTEFLLKAPINFVLE